LQKAELQSPMAALGRLFSIVARREADVSRKADYQNANNRPARDVPVSFKRPSSSRTT